MIAKRIFDLICVMAVFPVWLALLVPVAVLVRLKLGSPVLFRQQRPGLKGKIFRLVKFRSMTDARDSDGALLPDGDRLTRFGRWLRATSLDELPTFWNVMVGDMSLVGPRPLLPEYLPLYSARQARRHDVPPGVSGWAQVNGRNALSWDEKFELDVWYVDNRSLWLDIRILFRTAAKVLARDGISSPGDATMPPFTKDER